MTDVATGTLRETHYLDRIDFPDTQASTSIIAALDRAHELRKFEIENYWRRSTYVWGLQLVAFTALALSAKNGEFSGPIVIIVATLGIVSTFAAVLTSKGSRFWQKNWESHVDLLETKVEGRLHKTVLAKHGRPSFSVSRINERFLEMLLVGWALIFLAAAVVIADPRWMSLDPPVARRWQISVPLVFLVAAILRIYFTRSELTDRLYDVETMERSTGYSTNRLRSVLRAMLARCVST